MIDSLIKWSLKNRYFTVIFAFILIVWGAYEFTRMPVDVFPELTAPTVTIMTDAHGMAPQEVETLVTRPLETAMGGVPGVRRIRSVSDVGSSVIWVEMDWGTDIYRARQMVAEKLNLVRDDLPDTIAPPIMAPVTSVMGEVMFIAITSDDHTPMDVRTVADWTLKRRLKTVRGVAQVICFGGDVKQYQVILDPRRILSYGLTADEVADALRSTNENSSAGFYIEGGQEYVIHGIGRVGGEEDIGAAVVTLREGHPILVRDLGEVVVAPALKRGTGSYMASPAVVMSIQKQPDTNTLELTGRLDEALDDIEGSLPKGMKVHRHVFRQSDFIEVALSNVTSAVRDGAILVVLIILVFVMSLRSTFITALAIPLSLVTAIVVMKAMGETVNTMTLGGMAIAVGALVDDAIIDVENVVRRLRLRWELKEDKRRSVFEEVFLAVREIRSSIVFATFIIMLVFVPLFFLSGVEGRLLRPLGMAYMISLFASLVVAVTVTPALCLILLPGSKVVRKAKEPFVSRWLKQIFEPILIFALQRWKLVVGGSLAVLIAAILLLGITGRAFLPEFNEGTLTISLVTLPGTSLTESDRLGNRVEKILLRQPEVVSTARRTGRDDLDEHGLATNSAEVDVDLEMKDRNEAEFLKALRKEFEAIPGMTIIIGQPISHRIDHMLSGTRANVAVKIFGEDLYGRRRLSKQVEAVMQGIDGVADLSVEQQSDIPFVKVTYNRQAMARHGITVVDVSHAIETAFGGHPVSKVKEGQASYDLVLKYDPAVMENFESLREVMVVTPAGAAVPLHALAAVIKDAGPNAINRENNERKIVVSCNVAGRDLGSVVNDIRAGIKSEVNFESGYHVELGGQFQSAEEASKTLVLVGFVVVVGIFALLFIAFRSIRDAALVMINLPLALIGGVAGVYLTDGVLTVASIIGFISLFGIATRNGIMMISHIRHLMDKEGVTDLTVAVKRGAIERLIPILMTATASGLGLLPLALASGQPGSEIQAPMAIVIVFGLISSTILNMVVVPALYLRFGSTRKTDGEKNGA